MGMLGALFRRGMCRCGSAADARPLQAEAVAPVRGGDPALGPAFGPLPGAGAAWPSFTDGTITVVYTTDAAHPDHVLPAPLAAPPAQVPLPCTVAGLALGQITDATHPAHVQAVALMARHALAVFAGLGFRVPGAVTIRLCTFGGADADSYRGGTEVWLDHVWVSARLSGADAMLTVAHEIFHRVQYLYNDTIAKTSPLYAALREGSARLAEDWVLDSGDRYLKDGIEFLDDPGRPIVHHPGPGGEIAPHSYAAALFWRWLCEQHGEIRGTGGEGHDVMRTILERMIDPSGYILQDLREARGLVVGEGHLDRFQHLDVAAGEVLSTETDWGNFLVANWLHGTARPVPDQRFDYVEDDQGAGFSAKRPFVWPGETIRAAALAAKPFVFAIPPGAVRAGFAARYTVVDLAGTPPPLLRIGFETLDGMDDPLLQVILLRRDAAGTEHLHDLLRSDARRSEHIVPTAGLSQAVILVAAREAPGRYRLTVAADANRALLHAAPWNAAPGTSYETDPRAGAWPWTSPDLGVAADGTLRLRVTNRGDAPSPAQPVAFDAQGTTAAVPLRAGAWQAVGAATLPPIPPGGSAEVSLPWQPPRAPAAATGWALRARVGGLVALSSIGTLSLPERFDAVL